MLDQYPRRLSWFFLFLITCAGTARASTVEYLDVEQLSERASYIYQGVIVDRSHSVVDEQTPVTKIRLALTRVMKTRVTETPSEGWPETIDVLLPGGVAEGRRFEISGMPRFHEGEEVILFLSTADEAGCHWPIGLGQAKFQIVREAGRPARAIQSLNGMQRLDLGTRKPVAATGTHLLTDLLERIDLTVDLPAGPR